MGATVSVKNAMLDAITAITHISLHSADPGTTGANEISGGSPAYARKSVTYPAASGGERTIAEENAPVFDVPGGATVSHFAIWDGSTFLWGRAIRNEAGNPTTETWTNQGTLKLVDNALTQDTPD